MSLRENGNPKKELLMRDNSVFSKNNLMIGRICSSSIDT